MNGMLNNKIRTRADRILTNNIGKNITINKTTMIGTEPIETKEENKTNQNGNEINEDDQQSNKISDEKPIYPSDHFGIMISIKEW